MQNSVCLLSDRSDESWTHILPALASSGLDVWKAGSAEDCLSDRRSADMLCVIVDLPVVQAKDCLDTLRLAKIVSPALLVAERVEARMCLRASGWIDVLERPVTIRDLLGWIECLCAAHIAIERARHQQLRRAA